VESFTASERACFRGDSPVDHLLTLLWHFGIDQLWLSGTLIDFTPNKNFPWNATAKMGTMIDMLQIFYL